MSMFFKNLKTKKVVTITTIILFLPVATLPFLGVDYFLIRPFFLVFYILFLFMAFWEEKNGMAFILFVTSALIPGVEMLYLTDFSLNIDQVFQDHNNPGIFTHLGNGGESLFCLIIPFLLVNLKIKRNIFG